MAESCSYCLAEIGPRRVVSERHYCVTQRANHILCDACAPTVYEENVASLVDRLSHETAPTDLAQEIKWLVGVAQRFLAGNKAGNERELLAYRKFAEISECAPDRWKPIRVRGFVEPQWGEVPRFVAYGEIDGRHRLALKIAMKHALIRACPARRPCGENVPDYTYQTLAFPSGFVHGERTLDRFRLWPVDLAGERIIELACAGGVDGTLLVALGARSYYGIDKDVSVAQAVAAAWRLAGRSAFAAADLTADRPWLPPSDVAWILSSAIQIPLEVHLWGVRESGARTVFVETHREEGHVDDEPTRRLMAALPVRGWTLLGVSAYDRLNPKRLCRRLYRGEIAE